MCHTWGGSSDMWFFWALTTPSSWYDRPAIAHRHLQNQNEFFVTNWKFNSFPHISTCHICCLHLTHPWRGLQVVGASSLRVILLGFSYLMDKNFRHFLYFLRHPPPAFSIALSHSSFSRFIAFFLRSVSSTARFLLHRKLARLRVRSVSRGTSAPTGKQIVRPLCSSG